MASYLIFRDSVISVLPKHDQATVNLSGVNITFSLYKTVLKTQGVVGMKDVWDLGKGERKENFSYFICVQPCFDST